VPAANPILTLVNSWGYLLFDYGQCVYWAAEKYPSLPVNDTDNDPIAANWDGWTWAYHAYLEGYPISNTPKAGDIAVWTKTTSAQPYGHTAFVEVVNSNGSIVVSQMDGNSDFWPLQGSTEYLDASLLSQYTSQNGLMYIVAGDGDTGTPRSYVELPATATTKVELPKKTHKKKKKRKQKKKQHKKKRKH
jgi:surface antigen